MLEKNAINEIKREGVVAMENWACELESVMLQINVGDDLIINGTYSLLMLALKNRKWPTFGDKC